MIRKNYFNDSGASLLEVILALGIMAILTPVAMKFAFKDLSEIKYLNLAKQIKQVEKSLAAFSSTKRADWNVGTVDVKKEDEGGFLSYGLGDTIDSKLLENFSIRYKKSADTVDDFNNKQDGSLIVYGVIDMSDFSLTLNSFKKTLLYVGDNIGYAIKGEKCGECTASDCVCGVNGDWGVNYSDVSSLPFDEKDFIAVVRIDDTLLENEYSSEYYLYRNSQGGLKGNIMERDFFLGVGDVISNWFDIKEANGVFLKFLWGKKNNEYLPRVKATNADVVAGNIDILNAIVLGGSATLSVLEGKKIDVDELRIPKRSLSSNGEGAGQSLSSASTLNSFKLPNALLERDGLGGSYRPKIEVSGTALMEKLEVQNLEFTTPKYSEQSITVSITDDVSDSDVSKLKVELPNMDVSNLTTRIINVKNKEIASSSGMTTSSGVVNLSNSNTPAVVYVHNIAGSTPYVDLFSVISTFKSRVGTEADTVCSTVWGCVREAVDNIDLNTGS